MKNTHKCNSRWNSLHSTIELFISSFYYLNFLNFLKQNKRGEGRRKRIEVIEEKLIVLRDHLIL